MILVHKLWYGVYHNMIDFCVVGCKVRRRAMSIDRESDVKLVAWFILSCARINKLEVQLS